MLKESFVNYRHYRWMWVSLILVVGLGVVYLIDDPLGRPNGGTIYGYTAGGIATALIIFLMLYAKRKRAYSSNVGTLKGWLSAHVWLGTATLIIVPLHAGFQFGFNVHTLAYALLALVVVTGIWGAVRFVDLAPTVQSHRGSGSMRNLIDQIDILSADIEKLSADRSDSFMKILRSLDFEFKPKFWSLYRTSGFGEIDRNEAVQQLMSVEGDEREAARKLIGLLGKKREMAEKVRDEIRTFVAMRIWLFIHLPVAFGLVVALAIHIFSVFFMW